MRGADGSYSDPRVSMLLSIEDEFKIDERCVAVSWEGFMLEPVGANSARSLVSTPVDRG